MIGNAPLRKIISPDAFRPIAGTDLRFAVSGTLAVGALALGFKSRARSTCIALARFLCCDFSSCWLTVMPVGKCVMRTALSVVLTDCPPGRWRETHQSAVFFFDLNVHFSGSGKTATVAADV